MSEPIIIAVEGLDGSGKDTAIEALKSRLSSQGITYRVVQEPGNSPVGQQIRSILKNPENDIDSLTELFLFTASRVDNLRYLPKDVDVIIYNRWYMSTIAYQCFGHNEDVIEAMERYSKIMVPILQMTGIFNLYHRHLLIDCDVETSLQRARSRSDKCRIETNDNSFFERAREGFLSLDFSAYAGPDNAQVEIIENNSSLDDFNEKCYKIADELIAEVSICKED